MNVVVICSDTFRYDHLGFLKQQPAHTPNLNELAAQSGSFADFRVCSFPTLVNRMEVFSGQITFPFYGWGELPAEKPVLSEYLGRQGVHTALLADNFHLMTEEFGFGRGFTTVKDIPGQGSDEFQPEGAPEWELPCPEEKLYPRERRLSRFRRNQYWYEQRGTNTTEVLFRAAIDWLAKPPQKFFLWIDAFDPHEPWTAPSQYLKLYPWDDSAPGVIWPEAGFADKVYTPAELANIRSLYRSEVSQIDHWVGCLLEEMSRHKLLDDTAVLFLSDHGYYLDEHNLLGKPALRHIGRPLEIYEELGHMPLLIRHPGKLAAGTTIPGLTQPPDIFSTVVDLLEVPAAPWAQGYSLLPRLRGEPSQQTFAIGGCHPHERDGVGALTVWTDEWCLLYSPVGGLDRSALFHLPTDPGNRRNVIGENQPVAKELFDTLKGWLDRLEVSPARQQQLLADAPFTARHQAQNFLWRRRQHRTHRRNGWI